ncbi:MAG: hypothetical protein LBQ95_01575 [Lachnospiraceae bacterium]|jgi:hypothetical protein|nr:hypothetical protein [Lachnospiraceae bacterium]
MVRKICAVIIIGCLTFSLTGMAFVNDKDGAAVGESNTTLLTDGVEDSGNIAEETANSILANTNENSTTGSVILVTNQVTGETQTIEAVPEEKTVRIVDGITEVTEVYAIYFSVVNDTMEISQVAAIPSTTDLTKASSASYRGNVKITYTDDGTWACLKTAYGSWTRVSGTATISKCSITYGQYLGTNSKNGNKSFTSSVSVTTGFSKGKYGQGHFLGANIYGVVGGQGVSVVLNHYL